MASISCLAPARPETTARRRVMSADVEGGLPPGLLTADLPEGIGGGIFPGELRVGGPQEQPP